MGHQAELTDPEFFSELDTVLASHRAFGDSNYIRGEMVAVFLHRLERLADEVPAADRLLRALARLEPVILDRVMGDMVLRCAIQHAVWRVVLDWESGMPLDRCAEIFDSATKLIESGVEDSPLCSGSVAPEFVFASHSRSWVWSDDHVDDPFYRGFRDLVHSNYGAHPCTPTERELAGLRAGAELLDELMPKTFAGALSHVNVVGLFPQEGHWIGSASSSQFRLTGSLFLDRRSLGHPWWVAEHLLHEALHQKLYDFRHGHSLFVARSKVEDRRSIRSPWNSFAGGSNAWDAFRGFAAFHVYTHLAVLSAVADVCKPDAETRRTTMLPSWKGVDRARYLGHSLKVNCWKELGLAGQRFHQWLTSVLDVIDPSPPRDGACVHLLLDLYRNESKQAQLAEKVDPAVLASLLEQDIVATRSLLVDLGAPSDTLRRLAAQTAGAIPEQSGTYRDTFFDARTAIADTIQKCCHDGRDIAPVAGLEDPADRVWKLVEHSSERLGAVLAR